MDEAFDHERATPEITDVVEIMPGLGVAPVFDVELRNLLCAAAGRRIRRPASELGQSTIAEILRAPIGMKERIEKQFWKRSNCRTGCHRYAGSQHHLGPRRNRV